MAELIDKKAITESRDILDVLELFEMTPYISAESLIKFVDGLPFTTEAEIRAKAIDEFAERVSTFGTYDYHGNKIDVFEIAEQLKEE